MPRPRRCAGAPSRSSLLASVCASALVQFAAVATVHAEAAPPVATEGSVVLIVRSPGDERIVARLRGELTPTGCHIVELRPDPGQTDASLERLATIVSAAAAVRVKPEAGSIEVWVRERPGAPAIGIESISEPGPEVDDRVLALRATEALRARGLRLERRAPQGPIAKMPVTIEPPAAAGAPDVAARERAVPARASSTWRDLRGIWMEVGPASSLSPGGVAPSFDASFRLRVKYSQRWAAGAFVALPLLEQSVGGVEGQSHLWTAVAGGFADVAIVQSSWQLDAGAGIGGAMTRMTGNAQSGYVGATDNVIVAAPFACAAAHVELGAGWRVGAGALLGATLPAVSVRFAEREVATWGRPFFLLATLGIEAPLFTFVPLH